MKQLVIFFFAFFCFENSFAQFKFSGIVLDHQKNPAKGIEIYDAEDLISSTNESGYFEFTSNNNSIVVHGYRGKEVVFGHKFVLNLSKTSPDTIHFGEGDDLMLAIEISKGNKGTFIDEVKTKELRATPTIGSGIESLIQTLGGVSSGNEMSSQFSVRGGNFDENLIYVNDIEIIRPQLVQNGQQEGLSFINPDLVKSVKFSAGGFESQYGDKMSSVLDVEYVKPDTFKSQVNLGTMINSVSLEGSKKKFSGLLSFRHYSNSLLTGSLNTQGTYSMNFMDIQTYLEWKPSIRWNINFLGNFATNKFQLLPESRTTEFGTVQEAYQLNVFMGGQENMNYRYGLGALTVNYQANLKNSFKWILSLTDITEQEYFDIEGAYSLSELDRDLSSKNYGKPLRTLGYGYYLNHGRNQLKSQILNFSHLGNLGKSTSKISFKYGLRINKEIVTDRFLQWLYNDSAEYNSPTFSFSQDSIFLENYVRSINSIQSIRYSGFIQSNIALNKAKGLWMTVGLRAQYWNLNKEFILMPRFSIKYEPNKVFNAKSPDSLKKSDIAYKLSIGAYHQAPFYRELRDFEGNLNRNLLSQKSYHFVLGMDRYLTMWNRRFKYTVEGYAKYMTDLVPYLYDNIRIRYYAQNNSMGYAWGIDNRIYGQFNKGLESWFTVSVLETRERITYLNDNNESVQTDWLRRPTDKRVNFAIVFQDQLEKYPSIRVNLRMVVGTGIPYYLDGNARYSTTPNVIPPYRRLDMGFSKVLIQSKSGKSYYGINEAWVAVDIFNLLDINNVIAYGWVKDLNNNRYGVPEYLTGRRLNVRVYFTF